MNGSPPEFVVPVLIRRAGRVWKSAWAGWVCGAALMLIGVGSAFGQQAGPVILSQPQSTNVFLGSLVSFSVTVSSSSPVRYLWSGPAGSIPDGTNNTLVLSQVSLQDVGSYFVKVSNQFGSTQSTSAVLSVKQDWGDAPAQYPTLSNADGARHAILPGMYLGNGVTPEPDGQPDPAASADQADDGVAFVTPLVRGYPAKIRVIASVAGRLDGWLDFYAKGNWLDPVDQVFANTPLVAGTNFLTFNVPADSSLNNTFARFRFSSLGGLRFAGAAPDGEVEDYMLRILPAAADLCVTATGMLNQGGTTGHSGRLFLSVSNLGPSLANNVLATNVLSGADNISAQGEGSCTVQGDKVVCTLGNLESGQSKTIVVDFFRAQPGMLTNNFQARSDVIDPFVQNNRTNFVIRAADPLIITQAPRSIRVLPGSNVTFEVQAKGIGILGYQWFSNNLAVSGAIAPTFVVEDAQDSADFQVQVTDDISSVLSPIATLTVVRRPQVTGQPVPVSAPHGANVQFAAQVNGTPPLQFQWRLNGANIRGATNPVLTLNSISRANAGAYSLAAANDAGVANSEPAPLICSDIPTVNSADNMADRILLPSTGNNGFQGFIQTFNDNATIETGEPDLASKSPGHSIWFKWIAPASGVATFDTLGSTFDTLLGVFTGTNLTSLEPVASDEDSGGYFRSLVQFNAKADQTYAIALGGFSDKSGNAVLGWNLQPTTQLLPSFIQHPRSQAVPEGASVTLSVQVSNATPNTLYQWVFNGNPLATANGPDLVIQKVRPSNVGLYSLRMMGPAGTFVESRPAAVEIGPNPGAQSQDKLEDVLLNTSGSAGLRFAKSGGFPPFVSVALGVPGTQVMNNTNSTADIDCFQIGTATRWLGIQVTNLASVTNCVLRVDTAGSAIATELAVYRYISLACLQSVPCLHTNIMGCDTNGAGGGGSYSLLQFKPVPNGQYLVFADGLSGAEGIIRMNWQLGAAPAFTSSISNCTLVCNAGTNIVLNCGVTNAIPLPSYQWYYQGSPVANATNATLGFASIQPSNAGPYSVTISNSFGMLTNFCCLIVTPPQLTCTAAFTNGIPSTYSISSALLPGYILQYTTNLNSPSTWQNVLTNTTTNCTFLHVSPMIETNGQAFPQRYYRAVSP